MELPYLGVQFDPTDEQLINDFLRKRQRGENLPHSYIKECQIYEKEPWLIFDKDIKQIHYVFVRLIKKSEKMVQRTAGNGFWKGENNVDVKDEQGRVIGSKKLLTFQHDCVGNGRWVMHEFSIDKNDSLVVCAIRNRELDNVEQASPVMDFDSVFGARNQPLMERVENGVTENVQANPGEVLGTSSGSNLSVTSWEANGDLILPLVNATDSLFSEFTPDSAIGNTVNNVEQGSLVMDFEGMSGVQESANQHYWIKENGIMNSEFPSLQHQQNARVNPGELAGTSGLIYLSGTTWEAHEGPILQLGSASDSLFSECPPISAIGTSLEEAHCPDNTFNVNMDELAGTSGSNLCGIEWEGQGNPISQLANSSATCFSGPMSAFGSSSEEVHPVDTFNSNNAEQGSLVMDFEGVSGFQETANQQFWIEENGISSFEFPSLQHPENIQVNHGELAGTSAFNLCSTEWQVYGDLVSPIRSANTFNVNIGELAGTSGSDLSCLAWEANGDPILPLGNVADSVLSQCTTISASGTSLEEDQHQISNSNGCNVTTQLGFQASIPERERETNHTQLVSTHPDALVADSLIGQGAGCNWTTVVGVDVSSDYRPMSAEASGPNKRRRLTSCMSSHKRWGSSNVWTYV